MGIPARILKRQSHKEDRTVASFVTLYAFFIWTERGSCIIF